MKKAFYLISVLLLVLSGYMYINLDHGQDKLQASSVKVNERDRNAKNTKRNPWVIWNGSNEMPPGMGDTKKLKPATSDGQAGSQAAEPTGITPAPGKPGIDVSKGEGITPAIPGGSEADNSAESADDESVELNPGEGGNPGSMP